MSWESLKSNAHLWLEKKLGGHISIGPVTVFGFNAMHGQTEIKTKKYGYICFHPTIRMFGRWWPGQFYMSPNGTPWASTFLLGNGHTRLEKIAAIRRWIMWGHNYDTDTHNPHAEEEFFSDYVYHMRDGGTADVCNCCQGRMTWYEGEHGNVCMGCAVKELARLLGAEPGDDEPVDLELKGDGKTPWGQVTQ